MIQSKLFNSSSNDEVYLEFEKEKPKVRGTTKFTVFLIILCILLSTYIYYMTTFEYGFLKERYSELLSSHQMLSEKYNSLLNNYSKLQKLYLKLSEKHSILNKSYSELSERYIILQDNYKDLLSNYSKLNEEYANIKKQLENIQTLYFNPTYKQVKDFIAKDETDKNEYIENEYTCFDFSADVNNNAEKEGIRCGMVLIRFKSGEGHALVVFETVDKGLIFIEPQDDKEVKVAVGIRYWRDNYENVIVKHDDTITKVTIVW